MLDKFKSYLTCPQCGKVHIDEDAIVSYTNSKGKNFGREPHSNHLCAYCGSIFPDPYGKSIGWRSITDFDPNNYQNGWIVFYSVGMPPIMVDCKNDRPLMESVDVFGLFEEFLFVANGIFPAYNNQL